MKEKDKEQSVEKLQQLGFKEYEAQALVAIVALGGGTAKDVSNVSSVPRTRVYDATRVLEARGLVEVQHTTPQRFRATSVAETVETLEREYEDRFDSLEQHLSVLEADTESSASEVHEVWSLVGSAAIETRTETLVESATDEVVIVLGVEQTVTPSLIQRLNAATERGVRVIVGTTEQAIAMRIQTEVPDASVFDSGLGWLKPSGSEAEPTLGRLMLLDRTNILVSTYDRGQDSEQAVFGSGFNNGFVVVMRRLLLTGLMPSVERTVG
jgi:sugar-specific transcriptional regulator TrmB